MRVSVGVRASVPVICGEGRNVVLVPVRERSHKHRFPPSAAKFSVIFYSHRCVSQDARTIPACLRDAVLDLLTVLSPRE